MLIPLINNYHIHVLISNYFRLAEFVERELDSEAYVHEDMDENEEKGSNLSAYIPTCRCIYVSPLFVTAYILNAMNNKIVIQNNRFIIMVLNFTQTKIRNI